MFRDPFQVKLKKLCINFQHLIMEKSCEKGGKNIVKCLVYYYSRNCRAPSSKLEQLFIFTGRIS